MNLETIIDLQSWCRTWPPNGHNHTHVKQKLLRKHKGACKSSWSQIGNLKSFTLTILWNLAKPVKIFPGIIVRRQHTDQKHMGLTELRKGHLRFCCNQVWTKNGRRIPWNVTAICEAFKISGLMGRHLMRGVSEYHLKALFFLLERWYNITLFLLLKTCRDCICSARKFCQLYFSGMHRMRRIWKGDILVADMEELEHMTHVKSTQKDSMQRKC